MALNVNGDHGTKHTARHPGRLPRSGGRRGSPLAPLQPNSPGPKLRSEPEPPAPGEDLKMGFFGFSSQGPWVMDLPRADPMA
jgi:hypothetical protein